LYDVLQLMQPSPVVALNRAVAVAMVQGIEPALKIIDELAGSGNLEDYHLLHSTRADLLRRLGSWTEAAKSYRRALELATNESEKRFLKRRLGEMQAV
jgi:RNA polymerase sigma-70 factor (ECF subfamily)